MMPKATLTAERFLQSGDNEFDAIVAGKTVLGIVQPNMNGLGSDAILLIYDAKAQKVRSIGAEGTATRAATIDCLRRRRCLVHPPLPLGRQDLVGLLGSGTAPARRGLPGEPCAQFAGLPAGRIPVSIETVRTFFGWLKFVSAMISEASLEIEARDCVQ
jgi:hypothetical protein